MIFVHKETGEIFELGLYNPKIRELKNTILVTDNNGIQCLFFKDSLDFIGWV